MIHMTDLNLAQQRVLIREDLNVPIENGRITSSKRIDAALPTLRQALEQGAAVMVMSHLGRPTEGQYDPAFSLQPVADYLSQSLGQNVPLIRDWVNGGFSVQPGQMVLLENVRFNVGEKACDETLSRKMAALCDVFVMDAFGTAHRAQASTVGVAKYAPVACAGPLLVRELEALGKALKQPERPFLAIVGGSKVSTKLTVLESLSDIVDQLIVGGGIANTFIVASGYPVGKSLYEPDLVEKARELMATAKAKGATIPVPEDVVTATEFSPQAETTVKSVEDVSSDDMILDVGPKTATRFAKMAEAAATIVWNGPLGVFEFDAFGHGTETLARAIATSQAFSIAGGGDTLAAIDKYQLEDGISYISTGGGAFLEFLEGKTLPAVAILEERAQEAGQQT